MLTLISLIILSFYSSLIKQTYREIINNPNESQYIQLQQIYPSTLSCPCTSISMFYDTFITIQPHYHQVCSNDFVTSQWITYITSYYALPPSWSLDFRINGITSFTLLATFCQQIQQAIDDALQVFRQTQFVNSQVIPQQLLESQGDLLIQQWQLTTTNQYLHTIELFRTINQGNQLMNDVTSATWNLNQNSGETTIIPKIYSNCPCGLSQSCRSLMGIYQYDDYSENGVKFNTISNFFVGCFPIEALLVSTLECFYNRSCMIFLDQFLLYPLGNSFNFSALDTNRSSPYETIESIVNRLMVDSWSTNVSFSSYYNACAPLSCTFEYAACPANGQPE